MCTCIWNTPAEDRRCNYCTWSGGCENRKSQEMVAKEIHDEILSVFGREFMIRDRSNDIRWARYLYLYILRQRGLTYPKIEKITGLNHSTVIFALKNVEDMFSSPARYVDEFELWNKISYLEKQ